MSETWWTEPTPVAHHADPPVRRPRRPASIPPQEATYQEADTWWTEPTAVTHHADPPIVEAFAEGDVRADRWTVTLGAPTFTVTIQGADPW